MKKPVAMIIKAAGTNCDLETAGAVKRAGFDPKTVLINDLIEKPSMLHGSCFLLLPGGFSYGDDRGAGKILANEIRFKLMDDIRKFISEGKLVMGICNGFQVLTKAGLLPDPGAGKQQVTLTMNESGRFEARWVYLKVCSIKSEFLKERRIIELPVAHGEGRFLPIDETVLAEMEKNQQIVLKYVNEKGAEDVYPANPNGSIKSIAAVTDETGRILGMMPHPERFQDVYQHPSWTLKRPDEPHGMIFFRNAFDYVRKNL